jgi:hypothetical protein
MHGDAGRFSPVRADSGHLESGILADILEVGKGNSRDPLPVFRVSYHVLFRHYIGSRLIGKVPVVGVVDVALGYRAGGLCPYVIAVGKAAGGGLGTGLGQQG